MSRAIRILSLVARSEGGISLTDLSGIAHLSKSTVHRIARLLEQAGFVKRDPLRRKYTVGEGLTQLAFQAMRNSPRQHNIRVLMEQLSAKLRETINLGVLAGDEVVYIERVESAWPLRMDFSPGSRVPVHCTAIGKLLLAHAPARVRRRLIATKALAPLTPNTITSPVVFDREFRMLRRRGWAEDNEEFLAGVCCIAVPVRDERRRVLAGLVVSAPSARFPLDKGRTYVPDLQRCADLIAAQLGSSAPGSKPASSTTG